MAVQPKKREKKILSPRLYKLLRKIGNTFKVLRKKQGFSNSISFAVANKVNDSTYGKYEAGSENMTMESLIETAELLGLTEEDIFNAEFLSLGSGDNGLANKSWEYLIHQVRHEVSLVTDTKKANEFDDNDIGRIHLILNTGLNQVSKNDILRKLKLKGSTPNFEALLDFLMDSDWISMTHPESPNRPDQKYYTTELGEKVLRLGKE